MSIKILQIPRGLEKDLVVQLMKYFKLVSYSINSKPPYDTIVKLNSSQNVHSVVDHIECNIKHVRGQIVQLKTEIMQDHSSNDTNNRDSQNRSNGFSSNTQPKNGVSSIKPPKDAKGKNSHRLDEIKKNIRSLLATEKNGLDAMRLVNNYQELTNESFFDVITEVGYRTVTEFCNDNLDCLDYEAYNNGSSVVFHGIPDAKSAHIYVMNQATKSRHRPNLRPIPMKFQYKFGNFVKPLNRVREQQQQMQGAMEIPDKHRRRIIAVVGQQPDGLTTEGVKASYTKLYEEPFPMEHLSRLTLERDLSKILAQITTLKLVNNKWVVVSENAKPHPHTPEPVTVTDLSKSPEFATLKKKIISALEGTTSYTMTLQSLENIVGPDLKVFGKTSLAELIDFISEVKMRRADSSSWVVHLKHQGETLPPKIQLRIYNTLNSDPNGLLLNEFGSVYQRVNGRSIVAEDYGYKSIWHLLYSHPNICTMLPGKDALILVAKDKPETPSLPPGSTETRTSSTMGAYSSSSQSGATSPSVTSAQKGGCTRLIGELALGFHPFQVDADNLTCINIKVIYSPAEFYVYTDQNTTRLRSELDELQFNLNNTYRKATTQQTHAITSSLSLHQLVVFCDDDHNYHRAVVDLQPGPGDHTVRLRSVDTGLRHTFPVSKLYRLADDFRQIPCYVRRCSLYNIRPFHGVDWDPKCSGIFGPAQAESLYYAERKTESPQDTKLIVFDTSTDEDRRFTDVLIAEGFAEPITSENQEVNNAPASSHNSSFQDDEDQDDEDDDWLEDWLADSPPPIVSNIELTSFHKSPASGQRSFSDLKVHAADASPNLWERTQLQPSTPFKTPNNCTKMEAPNTFLQNLMSGRNRN